MSKHKKTPKDEKTRAGKLLSDILKSDALKALLSKNIKRSISLAKEIVNDLRTSDSVKVNLIDIKNNKNLGFAKAINQGAKIAKGDYLFFLNPDTVLLNNAIDILKEKTTVPFSFAPVHCSKQRAGALAMRAIELYYAGVVQTAAEHEPNYLRLSQAERELKEKQKKENALL